MKHLIELDNTRKALLAGLLTTFISAPYVLAYNRMPKQFLLVSLIILSVMMWQMVFAWTPQKKYLPEWDDITVFLRTSGLLIFSAVSLSLLSIFFADSYLIREIAGYGPGNPKEFWFTLAWTMSFQALFLVPFPFTCIYRLTNSSYTAIAGVVLFVEFLAFSKAQMLHLSPKCLFIFLAFSILKGLFCVFSYSKMGLPGLSLVSGIFYARFLLKLF
ncbi:MAG: hypothetical protein U9O87_01440 [Verrucomicrobiota bacterium]|nr:hypothetical protein [Verrucomicrobiota bacterium]